MMKRLTRYDAEQQSDGRIVAMRDIEEGEIIIVKLHTQRKTYSRMGEEKEGKCVI